MVDFQIPDSEESPMVVHSDLTWPNDQHGPRTVENIERLSTSQGFGKGVQHKR